jgi:hypothetical protein
MSGVLSLPSSRRPRAGFRQHVRRAARDLDPFGSFDEPVDIPRYRLECPDGRVLYGDGGQPGEEEAARLCGVEPTVVEPAPDPAPEPEPEPEPVLDRAADVLPSADVELLDPTTEPPPPLPVVPEAEPAPVSYSGEATALAPATEPPPYVPGLCDGGGNMVPPGDSRWMLMCDGTRTDEMLQANVPSGMSVFVELAYGYEGSTVFFGTWNPVLGLFNGQFFVVRNPTAALVIGLALGYGVRRFASKRLGDGVLVGSVISAGAGAGGVAAAGAARERLRVQR